MRRALTIASLTLAVITPQDGWAQQAGSLEPILQVTVDPPRVVVGQRTTLRVDVLAPNYMTAPPELPAFQVRNVVTRQLQSVNRSETLNGTTYAGVRFEFAIYPQEPGSYAIANQTLTVRYAAEPPVTREATMALPRIAFDAFIPDGASALDPFIAATKLTIEQAVQRSSDQLKTGDAVTRTVTIKAEGTPAMLLPPVTSPAIEGLALYPAQPSLQDRIDSRTDLLSSTRTDSATYMLERPGDYLLPAIDIRWWNAGEGKIELAHLDAVPLQVAANPAAESAAAADAGAGWNWGRLVDLVADHWAFVVLAFAALAVLGSITPRVAQTMAAGYRYRREAYLRSESFAFSRLRRAARRGDAKAAYFALLDWLQRFEPVAPLHTVESLKSAAGDPVLDLQIGAIEQRLFAPRRDADVWSLHQWLRVLSATRRRLRRRASRSARIRSSKHLNPVDDHAASVHRRRVPAR
jgi:oxygen tolerance protein BatD